MASSPNAKALRVLRTARGLIARPHGWTKRTFRKTQKNGVEAYCAIGSLTAAVGKLHLSYADADPAHQALNELVPSHSVVSFNDSKTTRKKDILALFDRAIEKLEASK